MITRKTRGGLSVVGLSSLAAFFAALTVATPPERIVQPAGRDPFASSKPYGALNTDLSDYIWPTNAGRIVTSTFAEFRRTHFHGGIDISTGNRTGYHVYAARDGHISRIRVSPTGYGKMLYVRHNDGYYTTYAHLEKFNAEIDARVRQEQERLERYPVKITCEPNEFPVKKGYIIAYTGETGTGTPHLHFEIRDEHLNLVNPLLCDSLYMVDNTLPTIRKIAIRPLGKDTQVQGGWKARTYSAQRISNGKYRIVQPIRLTGEAGFAINVRDRSHGSWYRHGVYTHQLFVDDTLLYTVRLDRAPARDAHQIGLYYDWGLLSKGRGRFEKLYSNSPNDLPFYSPKSYKAGIVNSASFAEGPHDFKIVSTDFNDNSSQVTGKIILNHPPAIDVERDSVSLVIRFDDIGSVHRVLVYTKRNRSSKWNLKTIRPDAKSNDRAIHVALDEARYDVVKVVAESKWGTKSKPIIHFLRKPDGPAGWAELTHEINPDFVRILLKTNRAFTDTPTVLLYEGETRRIVSLTPIDLDYYVGTFYPTESFAGTRRLVAKVEVNGQRFTEIDEFDLYPIAAGSSGNIRLDDGKLRIEHDRNSVFKTVLLQLDKQSSDGEDTYTLKPENTVLNRGLTVELDVDSSKQNQGLFFRGRGRGNWNLLATNDNNSSRITGRLTRTLGDLAVLVDSTPPRIHRVKITRISSRRPYISFRFGDNLSGVEYNELKMYIDSVIVIPEIDGEHRRAFYRVTEPLKSGSHQLTIRLKDKMGNTKEVERRFTVR
ncbi:MAG: M23 family metallopeptidase [Ignavibacteria bacterium]|nr:M23 family metallopeptidase [Ignavibacteria bacterium]